MGDGHKRIVLPLWLQKSFGAWTTFGGGGYVLNEHGDDRNYWIAGWAVLRKINENLQLGGELFYNGATSSSDRSSVGMNLGAIYGVGKNTNILASIGRGITNVRQTNEFSYFVSLQREF